MKSFLLIFLIGFTVQAKMQSGVNKLTREQELILESQQDLALLSDFELMNMCTSQVADTLRIQADRTRSITSEINYHLGRLSQYSIRREERTFATERLEVLQVRLEASRSREAEIQSMQNDREVECAGKIRLFRVNKYNFPLDF